MRPWLPLVLVLILSAAGRPAAAQTLTFGGKGGISISSISFDDPLLSAGADGVGFVGGGYIGYPLFGRFSVQGEGTFAETRVQIEDVIHDKLSYLDVPVLVRYRVFGTAPRLIVHAFGGAVWSWVLKAQETVGSSTSDIKDGIESNDLSFAFGADVEVHPRFLVDVRFLYGQNKVYKSFNAPSFGLRRGIQVTVAYRVH